VAVSPLSSEALILRPCEPEDVPGLEADLNHPTLIGRRCLPRSFSDYFPLSRQQVGKVVEKWSQTEEGMNLAVVQGDGIGQECASRRHSCFRMPQGD
jgi:hypothetical protein